MPGKPKRVYWDACVFLSYINGYPERVPTIEALLLVAAQPDPSIEIVTSTLSITEVAYSLREKAGFEPNDEDAEKIAKLWHPAASPVKLVESFRSINEEAARLMRSAALTKDHHKLTPPDAIHLASAKYLEVDEFHTYDDKNLSHFEGLMGFPIKPPFTDTPLLVPTPQPSEPLPAAQLEAMDALLRAESAQVNDGAQTEESASPQSTDPVSDLPHKTG